ncbi:MAG: porin [Acidobacteria bacterium]|nr:MAG: porin [Acidobacteriota bacterium]PYV69474.1 MAG: porin [Acidobacteriota bacterium]
MRNRFLRFLPFLVLALVALPSLAQDAPSSPQAAPSSAPAASPAPDTKPADPQPLPMPSMSGPLQTAPPREMEGGKLAVTGILSGIGWTEGNHVTGDDSSHWDISNAQVFVQKTTGWWQFYLQGGAYNLPAIGVPYLSTADTVKNIYGPFPQGYVKFVKGNFNVEVGALPTLIGAEYTFSFENMNIERGLLWNQENAVNRGVQLNWTHKKLTTAFSWNDGFYSNRYTWLSGSASWAFNAANSVSFIGMGNAGTYAKNTLATPLTLNNSQIYNLIYSYTKGAWVIQPYFQYTDVATNPSIGIFQGASTRGGAVLATYNFKRGFSLAVRPEYIKSSGNLASGSVNLLYGPGSGAFGFTVTPTYRKDAFFLRGDLAIVHATDSTPGFTFGTSGTSVNQPRGVLEAGFMF